ncbi:hypothetical protein EGW08_007707, partial [Elysia chlorotica]
RQQQQQQQQVDGYQNQSGRPIPEPRASLSSTDSVYGTPPNDPDGFNDLRDRKDERDPASSPGVHSASQSSVHGTPPTDSAEWLTFMRGRRLSNINEDSVDSARFESDERRGSQDSTSSARKKPRVITCSSQSLTSEDEAAHNPRPCSSPKSVNSKNAKNRSPSPSPKLKIPTSFGFDAAGRPPVVDSGKQRDNTSSGSSGIWSMTSGSGSTTSGSGRFTPAALDLMKKKKSRKESPPNPFFKNAHFMRSTLSSGSSNSSLGVPDEHPARFERGKSYRLSPQPLNSETSISQGDSPRTQRLTFLPKSPLAQGSGAAVTDSQTSSLMTRLESQTSCSEEFHLAPSAFRSDGTPVEDQRLATMFYESAKNKRKLFRRQSTVSSLNSISLEDRTSRSESSQGGDGDQGNDKEEDHGKGGASQSGSGQRFRDLFISLEQQSDTGSITEAKVYPFTSGGSNGGKFHSFTSSGSSEGRTHPSTSGGSGEGRVQFFPPGGASDQFHSTASDQTDSTFDPEVMDLSEFDGADEGDAGKAGAPEEQGDLEMGDLSSVKVTVRQGPALQHQISVENTDIWFDAKPCLS